LRSSLLCTPQLAQRSTSVESEPNYGRELPTNVLPRYHIPYVAQPL
jgi:hypothetical protein